MAFMGDRATEAPEYCLLERIRDNWPKFAITRNGTIQHRSGIAHENVTGLIVGGRSGWRRRAFKWEKTTWKLLHIHSCPFSLKDWVDKSIWMAQENCGRGYVYPRPLKPCGFSAAVILSR